MPNNGTYIPTTTTEPSSAEHCTRRPLATQQQHLLHPYEYSYKKQEFAHKTNAKHKQF
jgi:hypothetical protein